ncbi:flavodoxin family protein [Sneathiella sp.]|uniref:flavodoxin family protein n=1 Tax=Sneathiella sp. TaxID=1964365 RepID=UPI002FE1DCC3
MTKVAILYFSGYGHTQKQAEAVAAGAAGVNSVTVSSVRIPESGDITDADWETLLAADAIIYGSPTYMGGPAWQFKKFAEQTSKHYVSGVFRDKIAGGFTNSATVNGDKQETINAFFTFSQQLGQIWVGTGLLASNLKEHGPADVNWSGGYAGALAISPADASPEEAPPAGDLETARLLGERIATYAARTRTAVAA